MQQTVDEVVPVGTAVKIRCDGYDPIEGVIEGYGTVIRDNSGMENGGEVTVYEIEVTLGHVGYGDKVTLEGERLLVYRGAFDVPGEYVVEFRANFKSMVRASNEDEARAALISAISETLTWDGDDNAPDELTELEMRVL